MAWTARPVLALAFAAVLGFGWSSRTRSIPADSNRALVELFGVRPLPFASPCVPGLAWRAEAFLPLESSAEAVEIAASSARLSRLRPSEGNRCTEMVALAAAGKVPAAISRARDLLDDLPRLSRSTWVTIGGVLSLSSEPIDRLDALDASERARQGEWADAAAFNSRRAFGLLTDEGGAPTSTAASIEDELRLAAATSDGVFAAAIARNVAHSRFVLFERWIPLQTLHPTKELGSAIRTAGAILTRITDDRLPTELAAEFTPRAPATLVTAERARIAIDEQHRQQALEILAAVRTGDLDEHSPASQLLLALQQGRAYHYADRGDLAESLLSHVESVATARGFTAIAGRAAAVRGARLHRAGRLDEAVAAFERAGRFLDSARDEAGAGHVAAIHAGLCRDMGLERMAWRLHERAFQLLSGPSHPRHRYMAFAMAAETAFQQGRPHASARLNMESLRLARSWGDPAAISEELAHLAHARGPGRSNVRNLDAARALAAEASPGMQQELLADIALLDAALLSSRAPQNALAALAAAEPALLAQGDRLRMAELLIQRSILYAGSGRTAASDDSAWAALSSLENATKATLTFRDRVAVRDRWHAATRQLVSNAWRQGDSRLSLAILDGSRASANARVSAPIAGPGALLLQLDGVLAAMPEGHAAVSSVVLGTETLLLKLDRDGVRGVVIPVGKEQLEELTSSFRNRILRGLEYQELAARLFDLLIRPITPLPGHTLFLSPDPVLAGLPWAALFDRGSRRHLIEKCEIALSPSLVGRSNPGPEAPCPTRPDTSPPLVISSASAHPALAGR